MPIRRMRANPMPGFPPSYGAAGTALKYFQYVIEATQKHVTCGLFFQVQFL
jgi:hypothetical protein